MSGPRLSVVCPTHDRRDSVLRTMNALARQTVGPEAFEAIVVADGCGDDTVSSLRGSTLPFRLRVLEQQPARGPASARNVGAAAAEAPILVFVDDDIEPVPTMLEAYLRAHRRQPGLVVLGCCPPVVTGSSLFHIALRNWWLNHIRSLREVGHRFAYRDLHSGNFSVPASLFAQVRGFDTSFAHPGCEDYDLGARLLGLGAPFLFAADAVGHHHDLTGLDRSFHRARIEGRGDVLLGLRHPELRAGTLLGALRATPSRLVRSLRDLAFRRPPRGDRIAWGLRLALDVLEAGRLRHRFASLYVKVRTYWYCRGAAEELPWAHSWEALDRYFDVTTSAPELLDLDLAAGLVEAERRLDRERPAGARLGFAGRQIGVIPPQPGAEALRGAHLRTRLARDMPVPLLVALASQAARDARAWDRFFGQEGPRPRVRSTRTGLSVLVAAGGDEDTLAATLDSLDCGPSEAPEIIVAAPGENSAVARSSLRARKVPAHGGTAASWNAALAVATQDWVLCLRAGDRIHPRAIEACLATAETTSGVDAFVARWRIQGRDDVSGYPHSGDLFHVLAAYPAFPVEATLLRRERVAVVGGFDERIAFWPGWDLLQRLARSGGSFTALGELLADLSPPSQQWETLRPRLLEAFGVVRSGHGPDARLSPAQDAHPAGAAAIDERGARINLAAWAGGASIALGEDPGWIVPLLEGPRYPIVAPADVTHRLLRGMAEIRGRTSVAGERERERAARFLEQLERLSGTAALARRSAIVLERALVREHRGPRPATCGTTHGITWDITTPPGPCSLEPSVERLCCALTLEGRTIGTVDLPVCEGEVSPAVLADAAAAAHGWRILGDFFARTLYWPAGAERAELSDPFPAMEAYHDEHGWEVLLQEVWGRPEWAERRFYEEEHEGPPRVVDGRWTWVEASEPLTDIATAHESIDVGMTVGGAPVAVAQFVPEEGVVASGRVRSVLLQEAGLELVRVAVREGLLGSSWGDGPTLRDRLQDRASRREARSDWRVSGDARLAPGWERAATCALGQEGRGIVIPRHRGSFHLTPINRLARLPWAAAEEVRSAAEACAQPLIEAVGSSGKPPSLVYAPGILWSTADPAPPRPQPVPHPARAYDRHYFESFFAISRDPWAYDSPYERLKYEQTLRMLPERVSRALELGCAEGHFTVRLAPRAGELVAADISEVALQRAARRCAGLANVRFANLDLFRDPLPGTFDLIVCSELLYFAAGREELRATAGKLAAALRPGGHLVVAHANVLGDGEEGLGLDWAVPFGAHGIGRTLAQAPGLRFARELRTDSYRVQLFGRLEEGAAATGRTEPDFVEHAIQAVAIPPLAAAFRAAAERPSDAPPGPVETRRLPILMYHHVSSGLSGVPPGFVVAPETFEQQMAYLHEAGFYSTDLETWAEAAASKRPLPGRAVVLTFDDGYQDFADCAWPILDRYGFRAIVLLITDAVGGEYALDFARDHPSRLMGWNTILDLRDGGVAFGSHSTSHRPLTGLSPAEVVRDAARSRAVLARALGHDVSCFAYPYGDSDAVVQHLVGAAGFRFGLGTRPGLNGPADPLLQLRRVEVSGLDSMGRFIARLAGSP